MSGGPHLASNLTLPVLLFRSPEILLYSLATETLKLLSQMAEGAQRLGVRRYEEIPEENPSTDWLQPGSSVV